MSHKLFIICMILSTAVVSDVRAQIREDEADGFVWQRKWIGKYAEASDEYGNVIIPTSKGFKYINYKPNTDGDTFGYFLVTKGSKYGAYDIFGNEIVPPESKIPFRGVFNVKTADGKKAACALTPSGEILIPAQRGYTEITRHEDLLYKAYYQVKNGKLMGVCDIQGIEIVPPEYKYIFYSNQDGCFIAHKGKKYIHLDLALDTDGNVCSKSMRDSIDSNISVEELFQQAMNLPDSQYAKKVELFRAIVALDANNSKGYKALAYNNIGAVMEARGMPKYAKTYYQLAISNDPSFTLAAENLARAKSAAREQRWDNVINTLETVGNILNTAGQLSSAISGVADASYATSDTSTAGSTSSANNRKNNGNNLDALEARAAKAKEDARLTPLKNRESNVYDNYVDQLITMHTYPQKYDDAQRRSIQQKMKQIRTKWEEKGFKMYRSEWEDWDGR